MYRPTSSHPSLLYNDEGAARCSGSSMKFADNGVPILRDDEIENTALRLIRKVDPEFIASPSIAPIASILTYLQDNHGLIVSTADLGFKNGRKIRGKTILS